MALRWDWKGKCGEMLVERTLDGGSKHKVVISLYEGNCFLIMLEEKTKTYTMWSFFADKIHAKNCLGLSKGTTNIFLDDYTDRIKEITFYVNKSHNYKEVIALFVRAFDDITIRLKTV